MNILTDINFDYTLRIVALGSAILGALSGALGAFAVLRKQSLIGDTISHAALPGIAVAFFFTGNKTTTILLIGAALSGWLATLFILGIVKATRIKLDSALGLVLSVFFGFGLVMLTFIQKRPDANQAGLEKFLFGQAATLLAADVQMMAILAGVAVLALMLLWKEFKLLSFDEDFGATQGFAMNRINLMLTTLLVVAIVLGLQTVGVVLMSAMIVAPAAAARQWTDKLSTMVLLSAVFGVAAGVSGSLLSSRIPKLPTGPTIVLCISTVVLISIFVAPARGLLWRWLRRRRNRRQFRAEAVLLDLMDMARHHPNLEHPHAAAVLHTLNLDGRAVRNSLAELAERELVRPAGAGLWSLTQAGIAEAQQLERRFQAED